MRHAISLRRALLILFVAVIPVLLSTTPAQAHPFGPPQTAEITQDDATGEITVRWKAGASDDYSYLADHLQLLPPDRKMLDGAIFYVKADADLLAASPEFGEYLRSHIQVTDDDGNACTETVGPVDTLVADGVEIVASCAGAIDAAGVEITMMTDLHQSYRTLATGPSGQRFVYTATAPSHVWAFEGATVGGAGGSLGASAFLQLSAVLVVLLVATAAGIFWFRRRGRSALA